MEAAAGIPSDAVLSLRVGPTRRQAPLLSALSHPFRFATALDDACEPLRIDVFRPLAATCVALRAEELRYSLLLDGSVQDMAVRVKVKPVKSSKVTVEKERAGGPAEKLSACMKDSTAMTRDYLERHKLLQYIQSMLHAVIQAKPHDPFPFMMAQLAAACTRPPRSHRHRRRSCPCPASPPKEVMARSADLAMELASDPGHIPSVSATSTPLDLFSDPGVVSAKEVLETLEVPAGPSPDAEGPPKPTIEMEVAPASAIQDKVNKQDGEQYDELARLRSNLRRQLQEAVDGGKLASAVEQAVTLMAGNEDDEVQIREELVQLKIEHEELTRYVERLKRDLRELRRVNMDLRRQLVQITTSVDVSRPNSGQQSQE